MLKGDAEHMLRRTMEDTGATFTEEQISCLSLAIIKIAGRILEEAVSAMPRGGGAGQGKSKPQFFAD